MIDVSTNNLSYNFPLHDIPSSDKGKKWHLNYMRAMYKEATTRQYARIFFAARDDYRKFKEYGLAKQSILQYRKWLTGSDPNDKTWINISWQVPPIAAKYRNILINKLVSRQYNITATPVDPLAVDETAKWFSELKAKMKMREIAGRINPELLNTHALRKRPEDPEDMEEFEMKTELGFKTKIAMDAELGISVVFEQNDIKQERRMVVEDIVDLGVGIYKDFIDDDDTVGLRSVRPYNFICNYCRRNDFADMTWGGELNWVKLSDIAESFTKDEMKDMAENVAGKNGNPRNVPYNFSAADYDRFKVLVLDGEWISYNTDYYKRDYMSNGNYSFKKKKAVDMRDGNASIDINGKEKPKYTTDETEVVYKGCWIVDTEYIYNWGLATDQKRRKSSYKNTSLSFHAYAPDFYEMTALGLMERIIPLIDNYCTTWFKVQNFLNKWIPYIIEINYDALENVNIGKGGKKMEPIQLLDMLTQTNMIVVRKKNAISGLPEQSSSVTVQATAMANEIQVLLQQMETIKEMIRDVTGINETIDGTSPEPRTNIPAQQMAQQGANNATMHFAYADKVLLEKLADACLLRLQRVIKRKPQSGYVRSLGSNYIKFVQVSPDISIHEYAIFTSDQPDDQMKQLLMQQLDIKNQAGLVEPEDYFTIINMSNLKEAEMKLIYSIKKRKAEQQQNALAQQQQTGQIQIQSGQAAELAKQQTLKLEYQLKMQLEDHIGAWAYITQAEKLGVQLQQTHIDTATKLIQQGVQHSSDMQQIAAKNTQQNQPQDQTSPMPEQNQGIAQPPQ
jgi:hypothetical protein